MKNKKLIVLLLSLLISTIFTSCSSDEVIGNVGKITQNPGDIFAVFNFQDYGKVTVKLFPKVAKVGVEKFTTLAERGYYDGKTIHRVIKDMMFQGGSLNGDGLDGGILEEEYFDVEASKDARHFNGALSFAKSKKGNYGQFFFVNNCPKEDIDSIIAKIEGQLADPEFVARLPEDKKEYYNSYLKKLKDNYPPEVKEKYKEVGGAFNLDGDYTVFGQAIDGFDVLDKISNSEVVAGNPVDDTRNIDSKPFNAIIIEKIEIIRIPMPVVTTTVETKKPKRTKATTTTAPYVEETTIETTPVVETVTVATETTIPTEETTAPTTVETAATTVSSEALDTVETVSTTITFTTPIITTTTAATTTTVTTTIATTTEETTEAETEETEEETEETEEETEETEEETDVSEEETAEETEPPVIEETTVTTVVTTAAATTTTKYITAYPDELIPD